ncbi:(2Fe-2S) ferredoxin domain-containing protein [Plectonema cf. radiosum LEGE 06105]|uniref:(2Fe-2S) ferredoxin domain-containing protein n=1 Tax=Plectonema cf. radiosum LEGE 06105 TaxID=945769 RepID=A0A8J7EX59_9CYAN|nr:(2Fe-2S) ferredoxin domain-containing protein [Plectonema radiosum]MBE9211746.1 (2Fe-2S) ferredoxin domain-containing protein [Plectonema cf. radiosum LEGE 06105]
MGDNYRTLSEFNLKGEFVGFIGDKLEKAKHLHLITPNGEIQIKLPKILRKSAASFLAPGKQINVFGVTKLNLTTGKTKLKVYGIKPIESCPKQNISPKTKPKILVCQKPGCRKRGSHNILPELEKILRERGLYDKVAIEHTGCLKCCSSPNCILKLGKKEYRKIHPEVIATMLEKHLG